MNLRKVLLIATLSLFALLMFFNFTAFALISTLASDQGLSFAELAGSVNALMIWLQFPLSILIFVILIYLVLGDQSLTEQNSKK